MSVQALKEKYYSDPKYNGTLQFYGWLRKLTEPHFHVLNLGAGPAPDDKRRSLKGEVAELVGADIDPVVISNTELDKAVLIEDGRIPLEDGSFDLIYSDFVLEHVEKSVAISF